MNLNKTFFRYLNSRHPYIKFTTENETNKFLPFLDALVKNEERGFTIGRKRLWHFLHNVIFLHLSATKSVL